MNLLLVAWTLVTATAFAQSVDIKDVNAKSDDTTTIQIHKGKANDPSKCEALWDVQDGSAEVIGEPATMSREARSNWKSACDEWKSEFRKDNKDNKIISINCGVPSCTGETGSKSCTSKATYKVKTKLN